MKTIPQELKEMILNSFVEYTKSVKESENILSIDLGQCAVVIKFENDINMYHIFISENEHLPINGSFRNLLQSEIDAIVAAWNPFQEYEVNPIEINTTSYINYLKG